MWSTMKHNGTVFLIDTYQKYPELVDLALRHREAMSLVTRVVFLLSLLLVIRGIVRTCVDPFSLSLRVKVMELENKLEEEESVYQELYDEHEELKQKFKESEARLRRSEALVSTLETKYLCCRQAAQKFLDTKPEAES